MAELDSNRKVIRPELASLDAYSPHKSPETLDVIPPERIIKLDANENPYGCSPRVSKALSQVDNWNIYPDANQTKLRQQLQIYTGIKADHIVAANGSGELLNDIFNLVLTPNDEVINCTPTFDLYRFRTLINRGRLIDVPRDNTFAINISAIKSAITQKTKLIVIANPNNPTGNVTPQSDIQELIDTGILVLIDEAYFEFCGETMAPQLTNYPNLMIIRTFSKWAGLAGLRIGYGFFKPEIAQHLLKIKLPYNVNAAAQVAVSESLKDVEYLKQQINLIIEERARLFKKLQEIDWLEPFPSQANFILCRVNKGNAHGIYNKLQARGILIRYFDKPRLQDCIRISVGKPEQTTKLLSALQELGKELHV